MADVVLNSVLEVTFPPSPSWMKGWEYDSVIGWTMGVTDETNSQGLRSLDVSVEKGKKKRVLFLGDSFAYGLGETFDSNFAVVLGKRERVEAVNLGTPGYGTDQALLSYVERGKEYKADLVVLIFYPNDFAENLLVYDNGLISPNFVERDGRLKVDNVPVPVVPGWGPGWLRNGGWRGLLFEHSYFYRSWNAWRVDRLERLPYDYDVMPTPDFLQKSQVTLKIIEALQQEVEKDGARLAVVTVPYLTMINDQISVEAYEDFFDPLERRSVAVYHSNGLFYSQEGKGLEMYSRAHRHWNQQGHREFAHFLENSVLT